jgi:hypothetical protein
MRCKVSLEAKAYFRAKTFSSHEFRHPWQESDGAKFDVGDDPEVWCESARLSVIVEIPDDCQNPPAEAERKAVDIAPPTGLEAMAERIVVQASRTAFNAVEIIFDISIGADEAIQLLRRTSACRALSIAAARFFGAYERQPSVWHVPWYTNPDSPMNINSVDSLACDPLHAAQLINRRHPRRFRDLAATALTMMAEDRQDGAHQFARYLLAALIGAENQTVPTATTAMEAAQ